MKKSILFHQACTSGWRRGSELRREVAAGCWDRSTFKALSFHLFSFCISLLFRWKGKGERGGERETIHVLKHTEERPGWPSLIKGIFQGRLTSLSTMLRQDSPTANSPPPSPLPTLTNCSCQREIFIFAWEKKVQTPIPNVTINENQVGLTCGHKVVAFI